MLDFIVARLKKIILYMIDKLNIYDKTTLTIELYLIC